MIWVLLGGMLLFACLLLAQALVSADPKVVARILRYAGAAVLMLVSIPVILRGGLAIGLPLIGFALILLGKRSPIPLGPLSGLAAGLSGSTQRSAGQTSTIETATLSMTLNHDSGDMDGLVRTGRLEGQRLSALSIEALQSLLSECQASDPDAAALLQAYIDRHRQEEWRAASQGHSETEMPGTGSSAMTQTEAYAILGLEPPVSRAAIAEAHRALMKKLHPDHGGSTYLASKINQAKDLLLGL